MMRLLLSFVLAVNFLSACANGDAPSADPPTERASSPVVVEAPGAELPYRFNEPEAAFAFPRALREISGLTVLDEGHIGAIQDEDGLLFVLDRETGRVVAQRRFRGSGDYEGLERVGSTVWVLKSDGSLYEIRDPESDAPHSEKVDTPLRGSCDAEGLAYDEAHERLLIACKENPGRQLEGVRGIYAYDLASRTLSEAPVILLQRAALDRENELFKPSALGIQPSTGRIYVISSVRKALAVLEPDGTLVTVVDLPDRLFPQPEGLTFFSDGTLFIANEGGLGAATLLRFTEHAP